MHGRSCLPEEDVAGYYGEGEVDAGQEVNRSYAAIGIGLAAELGLGAGAFHEFQYL